MSLDDQIREAVERALAGARGHFESSIRSVAYDVARAAAEEAAKVAERYERKSIAITANAPFSAWDEVFPDKAMTVAAVDRLIHHATILEFDGESMRAKEGSMNYVFTDDPKIELRGYQNKHVYVTGEEWVDARWPRKPLLSVQSISSID